MKITASSSKTVNFVKCSAALKNFKTTKITVKGRKTLILKNKNRL